MTQERQAFMDGVMARAAAIDTDLAPLIVDTSHGTASVEGTSGACPLSHLVPSNSNTIC